MELVWYIFLPTNSMKLLPVQYPLYEQQQEHHHHHHLAKTHLKFAEQIWHENIRDVACDLLCSTSAAGELIHRPHVSHWHLSKRLLRLGARGNANPNLANGLCFVRICE